MVNKKESLLKGAVVIPRIAFGALFIWASFNKLLDPQGFAEIIDNYKLLPPQLVNLPAIVFPWIELVCGVLLIIGFFHRGSVLIINCLLIFFMAALGHALYHGLDIRCGCFTLSPDADKIAAIDLIIDGVLLMWGGWVLCGEKLLSPKPEIRTEEGI